MGFRPCPMLRAALELAAKQNGRSLSQEIISRLERSFERPPDWELYVTRAQAREDEPA